MGEVARLEIKSLHVRRGSRKSERVTHPFDKALGKCSPCCRGCAGSSWRWRARGLPPRIPQPWGLRAATWIKRHRGGKKTPALNGQHTYLLGNTLVIPPSVAANTARKPYLKVGMKTGERKWLTVAFKYWIPLFSPRCGQNCTHVFKSLFFHTLSTSCRMMPVSRMRLWRSRLSPEHIVRGGRLTAIRILPSKEEGEVHTGTGTKNT